MLCNLSANFTNKTLMSFDIARISFLKFSACDLFSENVSIFDNFVTPSTRFATSFPKYSIISSFDASVSSRVSCNSPVVIVDTSSFSEASIFATSIG